MILPYWVSQRFPFERKKKKPSGEARELSRGDRLCLFACLYNLNGWSGKELTSTIPLVSPVLLILSSVPSAFSWSPRLLQVLKCSETLSVQEEVMKRPLDPIASVSWYN